MSALLVVLAAVRSWPALAVAIVVGLGWGARDVGAAIVQTFAVVHFGFWRTLTYHPPTKVERQ